MTPAVDIEWDHDAGNKQLRRLAAKVVEFQDGTLILLDWGGGSSRSVPSQNRSEAADKQYEHWLPALVELRRGGRGSGSNNSGSPGAATERPEHMPGAAGAMPAGTPEERDAFLPGERPGKEALVAEAAALLKDVPPFEGVTLQDAVAKLAAMRVAETAAEGGEEGEKDVDDVAAHTEALQIAVARELKRKMVAEMEEEDAAFAEAARQTAAARALVKRAAAAAPIATVTVTPGMTAAEKAAADTAAWLKFGEGLTTKLASENPPLGRLVEQDVILTVEKDGEKTTREAGLTRPWSPEEADMYTTVMLEMIKSVDFSFPRVAKQLGRTTCEVVDRYRCGWKQTKAYSEFKMTKRKVRKAALEEDHERKIKDGEVCATCHFGGTLVICDGCNLCFHSTCVKLDVIPDGDWFCARCEVRKPSASVSPAPAVVGNGNQLEGETEDVPSGVGGDAEGQGSH